MSQKANTAFLFAPAFNDGFALLSEMDKELFRTLMQNTRTGKAVCTVRAYKSFIPKLGIFLRLQLRHSLWLVLSCSTCRKTDQTRFRFWTFEGYKQPAIAAPWFPTTFTELVHSHWSFAQCPKDYFNLEPSDCWCEGLDWFDDPEWGVAKRVVASKTRQTGPVAAFMAAVTQWQCQQDGQASAQVKPPKFHNGRPVTLIPSAFLEHLNRRLEGVTVLVPTPDLAKRLRAQGFSKVEDLSDAWDKTFEITLLVGFFENIPANEPAGKAMGTALTQLLVALNHCRGLVAIETPELPGLWDLPLFKDHVARAENMIDAEIALQALTSDKAWQALGERHANQHRLQAAEACFYQGSAGAKGRHCRARLTQEQGDDEEAARFFLQAMDRRSAALCYEQAENYQAALILWTRLKEKQEAERCRLKMMAAEGRWAHLGRYYMSNEKYRESLRCYERGGLYRKAARVAEKYLLDLPKAAELYERNGDYRLAAPIHERLKSYPDAFRLFMLARQPGKAQRLIPFLDPSQIRIMIPTQSAELLMLLGYYERKEDLNQCLALLVDRNADELRHEAELAMGERAYFAAYVRYRTLNDGEGIAKAALKLKNYQEAGDAFVSIGNYTAACTAYFQGSLFKDALTASMNIGQSQGQEASWYRARRIFKKIKDTAWLTRTANHLLKQGDFEKAAFLYKRLGMALQEGHCLLALSQTELVKELWADICEACHLNKAIESCLTLNQIRFGAELVLSQPCFNDWHKEKFHEGSAPAVFALMERYFEETQDAQGFGVWAKRMSTWDKTGRLAYRAFVTLERLEEKQAMVDMLERWCKQARIWVELTGRFLMDLEEKRWTSAFGKQLRAQATASHHLLRQRPPMCFAVSLFLMQLSFSFGHELPPRPYVLVDASLGYLVFSEGWLTGLRGLDFQRSPEVGQTLWFGVAETSDHGKVTVTAVERDDAGWKVKVALSDGRRPKRISQNHKALILFPAPEKTPSFVPSPENLLPEDPTRKKIGPSLDLDGDGVPELILAEACCFGSWDTSSSHCIQGTCEEIWRWAQISWTSAQPEWFRWISRR